MLNSWFLSSPCQQVASKIRKLKGIFHEGSAGASDPHIYEGHTRKYKFRSDGQEKGAQYRNIREHEFKFSCTVSSHKMAKPTFSRSQLCVEGGDIKLFFDVVCVILCVLFISMMYITLENLLLFYFVFQVFSVVSLLYNYWFLLFFFYIKIDFQHRLVF